MSVISAIGHVALQVRDLDANLEHADRILGLRAVGQADEWTYLTHGAPHHSLQYKPGRIDGLDHIGLEAPDHEALDEVRRRVENEGCEIVSNDPLDPMLEMGFAFTGPGGFLFEVYTQMPSDQSRALATVGARPTRFGHVNITCPETEALTDFCVRVLDFRISDNGGPVCFLRCNVDHHGLAIFPGERSRLHHHAWEVCNIAELQQVADRLDAHDRSIIWGPVRHGMGRNIAVYFLDPAGTVVEYYCDMERIYDDAAYVIKEWDMEGHKWYSLWAPGLPEGFLDHGIDLVPRS